MQMIGQFHAPAALSSLKKPPSRPGGEVAYSSKSVTLLTELSRLVFVLDYIKINVYFFSVWISISMPARADL